MNLPNIGTYVPQAIAESTCGRALGKLDEQVSNAGNLRGAGSCSAESVVILDGMKLTVSVKLERAS